MLNPIQYLDHHDLGFPPAHYALNQPDGLLAVGGDLAPERLFDAYHQGIFPWFNEGEPILWWCPSQRAIFKPFEVKLSRSTRRQSQKLGYEYSINQNFNDVIRACAAPRGGIDGTWISEPMIQAYQQLHRQKLAHSIEIWHKDQLVGGLYGIGVGGVFCGESMFYRQSGASKLALYLLAKHCQQLQVELIDAQILNPHLSSLGAIVIPRAQFLFTLKQLHQRAVAWQHWTQPRRALHD